VATVDEYLHAQGVRLPVLERDEWAYIDATSPVGSDIAKLWLEAQELWSSCHDVGKDLRDAMIPHLVLQCDIWYFG